MDSGRWFFGFGWEVSVVEVLVTVDGGAGDAAALLAWLRRDPEARKLALVGGPNDGDNPSEVEWITVLLNTVTQLGALVMAIVAFRATRPRSACPRVAFSAAGGAAVGVDNADAETIKQVWDVVNAVDDRGRAD